nr:zinc finger BED domain-containing protein 5-like [Onthophagus taurus]
MANDIKDQIKSSPFFALQMDESTASIFSLLYDNQMKEEFLFCEPLTSSTTSVEIFNKVNNFIVKHGFDWLKCVGICSDGARAMTGKYGGVVTRIKEVAPDCVFIHCSINRQALAAKEMPDELGFALDDAMLFRILCSETGSIHDNLRLHTEVRWLSRELPTNLNAADQEKLIELSCDGELKMEFKVSDLGEFWARRVSEYPSLAKQALEYFMPFPTTYLCEKGFSSMLYIKSTYRNKLDLEPDLSNVEPNIDKLSKNMQQHPSH